MRGAVYMCDATPYVWVRCPHENECGRRAGVNVVCICAVRVGWYISCMRARIGSGVETISARVYGMHVPRWILLAYKS